MLAYVNGQVVNLDGPAPTIADALLAADTVPASGTSLLATVGRVTRRAKTTNRLAPNTRVTTAPRVYAG